MLNGKVHCWTLMIVGCQVEGLKSWKMSGSHCLDNKSWITCNPLTLSKFYHLIMEMVDNEDAKVCKVIITKPMQWVNDNIHNCMKEIKHIR